jgi:hypothetical protein
MLRIVTRQYQRLGEAGKLRVNGKEIALTNFPASCACPAARTRSAATRR